MAEPEPMGSLRGGRPAVGAPATRGRRARGWGRPRRWALGLACAVGLAACAPAPLLPPGVTGSGQASPGGRSSASGGGTSIESEPPEPDACQVMAESLEPAELAGQLLMVGVSISGADTSAQSAIRDAKAGSVVLLGSGPTSTNEVRRTAATVGSLGSASLPMLVAVDQEGGQVQRLRGEGFSTMPSAVEQGALEPDDLRGRAEGWGQELHDAGVRFNLAPSADVVPADRIQSNAPIGRLERYYSSDPGEAAESVVAFVEGMDAAGVATSVKHFPGLGRVDENTDYEAATDTETKPDDPSWEPFLAGMGAGATSVMISSGIFEQLDPENEAVFSEAIMRETLRDRLGFDGVIIADDLGAAGSVADIPAGERAVRFIAAGGDLVINADPALAKPMASAIVERMEQDPEFADQVTDSVARVLRLKEGVDVGSCG